MNDLQKHENALIHEAYIQGYAEGMKDVLKCLSNLEQKGNVMLSSVLGKMDGYVQEPLQA